MVKKQNGFSLNMVLVALVIICVIGFTGWVIAHNKNSANKTHNTTTQSSESVASSTNNKNNEQPIDPTANWKTYCDSHGYCFKYPNDWSVDVTSSQVTVLNPDKSVEVDYIYAYVHDSGTLNFYPVYTHDLAVQGDALKIVGGVYLPANEADYGVVDSSLLNTYPLTIGQSTSFPNALRFTDQHAASSTSIAFRARTTSQMSSLSAAQDWFNSTDAKNSLLILQSLSHK